MLRKLYSRSLPSIRGLLFGFTPKVSFRTTAASLEQVGDTRHQVGDNRVFIYHCNHKWAFRISSMCMAAQWAFTTNSAVLAMNIPGGLESYGMAMTCVTAIASTAVVLAVPWFAKHVIHEIHLLPLCTKQKLPQRLSITPHSMYGIGEPFEVALHNIVRVIPPRSTTQEGRDRFQPLKVFTHKSNLLLDKTKGEFLSGYSLDTFNAMLPSSSLSNTDSVKSSTPATGVAKGFERHGTGAASNSSKQGVAVPELSRSKRLKNKKKRSNHFKTK